MDTYCFVVHLKTDDIYKDVASDAESKFDTSNFEIDHCLKEKINKLNQVDKHEIICWINSKNSYLKDNNNEDKKAKKKKKKKACHKKKT